MNLDPTKFSSLARTIDPAYPSNLFAIAAGIVSLVIGLIFAATRLDDPELLTIIWWGVNLAGASFLAWALARELDPDHTLSAEIAAVLAPVILISVETIPGWQGLIALGLMLLTARTVSRTTGRKLMLTDAIVIIVLTALTGLTDLWMVGVIAAIALFADSMLIYPNLPSRGYAAVAMAAVLVAAMLTDNLGWHQFDGLELLIVATAALATFWVARRMPDQLASTTDTGDEHLHQSRVAYSINLTALVLILVSWTTQDEILRLIPLWAAILGLIGRQLYQMVTGKT